MQQHVCFAANLQMEDIYRARIVEGCLGSLLGMYEMCTGRSKQTLDREENGNGQMNLPQALLLMVHYHAATDLLHFDE